MCAHVRTQRQENANLVLLDIYCPLLAGKIFCLYNLSLPNNNGMLALLRTVALLYSLLFLEQVLLLPVCL